MDFNLDTLTIPFSKTFKQEVQANLSWLQWTETELSGKYPDLARPSSGFWFLV